MSQRRREFLFRVGLVLLVLMLVWSPICYYLYRGLWNFDAGYAVLCGFFIALAAGVLIMFGKGWKRLPLGILVLGDLLFWWGFSIMAGWS